MFSYTKLLGAHQKLEDATAKCDGYEKGRIFALVVSHNRLQDCLKVQEAITFVQCNEVSQGT